MLNQLPEWLRIFILSMMPGIEAKLTVPVLALYQYKWTWYHAVPIGIMGNFMLVPIGLLFFHKLEKFLSKYEKIQRFMDWFFPRIRNKANKKIQQYKHLALIFFVAIPLPFTGAGLGVVIAYLFNFEIKKSLIMILIGIIIATLITTFTYMAFEYVIFYKSY